MKNKLVKIIFGCMFAALFISCGNLFTQNQLETVGEQSQQDSLITFDVNEILDEARTALPVFDAKELTGITVTAKDAQNKTVTYGPFDTISDTKLSIKTGTWSFTVSANIAKNTFSAEVTNLVVDKTETTVGLTFSIVSYDTTTKGGVSVQLKLPSADSEIRYLEAALYDFSNGTPEIISTIKDTKTSTTSVITSYTYEKMDLAAGLYLLQIDLYTSSLKTAKLGTVKELVIIKGGLTSKSNLTFEKVNKSYAITFNLNEGSWSGFTAPSSYFRQEVVLPVESDLTKTGYVFGGWYDNAALEGDAVTKILDSDSGEKTYYAKWIKGYPYKVIYSKEALEEGGTPETESEIRYGLASAKTNAVAKKIEGFTAKAFEQKDIVATEDESQCTNVVIEYERNTITYTFDLDGGTVTGLLTDGTISGKYGSSLSLAKPTKEDKYFFVGWNEKDGVLPATFGSEAKTFKAIWSAGYKITYSSSYAQSSLPTIKTVAPGYALPAEMLPTLTSTGYVFMGWKVNSTSERVAAGYKVNSDIILEAVWASTSLTGAQPRLHAYTMSAPYESNLLNDGDKKFSPGETVYMDIRIYNAGGSSASSVTGKLSTKNSADSDKISFTRSSISYGTIGSHFYKTGNYIKTYSYSTTSNTGVTSTTSTYYTLHTGQTYASYNFVFKISETAKPGTRIPLTLTLSTSSSSTTSVETIYVEVEEREKSSFVCESVRNYSGRQSTILTETEQIQDVSDTIYVDADIRNYSVSSTIGYMIGVKGKLTSTSTYVTIRTSELNYGNIAATNCGKNANYLKSYTTSGTGVTTLSPIDASSLSTYTSYLYSYKINPETPEGTVIPFELTFTDIAGNEYKTNWSVITKNITNAVTVVDENHTKSLDGSCYMDVKFCNGSNRAFSSLKGVVKTSSPYITFTRDTVGYSGSSFSLGTGLYLSGNRRGSYPSGSISANVAASASATNSTYFYVFEVTDAFKNLPVGTSVEADLVFEFTDDAGYKYVEKRKITETR